MTCAGNNTIAALLAGAVDAGAAARLEVHLDRCTTCRELVARLGRGLSAIGEAPITRLPQIGERIGRYVIRRVVGVGGMGVVYEAHDTALDRRVAVKLLRPELHHADLLAEAQAMARLAHPNIVSVFDTGIANDQLYICMEYVAGTTLRAWTRGRTWREIVEVYAAAGEGLAYVHRAGLVHLDFKPDNVLVDRDGRARVTDFGLARMLDAPAQRGLLAGTLAYMPPEQRRCEATDERSDQYAFCASLKEALGDRGPAWLHRVLARGMAEVRADRFASMTALLARLRPRPRRRFGGVLVIASTTAAALALILPDHPSVARTRIVERPTTRIVERAIPTPLAIVVPVPREPVPREPVPGELERVARRATPAAIAPANRRDFTRVLAMLARAGMPSVHVTASAASTSDDDDAGEPGPCDDGSQRTCSIEIPQCPGDTIVALQAGCWTCADADTCTPLGIPCTDGTCTWMLSPLPPPRPVRHVGSIPHHHHAPSPSPGSGTGAGSGSGSGSGAGSGSGSGAGSGSG